MKSIISKKVQVSKKSKSLPFLTLFVTLFTCLWLYSLPLAAQEYTFKGQIGTNDGRFQNPRGVALDVYGNVYIADNYNHRIQKFDLQGNFIAKFGSQGQGDGQFQGPSDIAIDEQGNIYVSDSYNNRIQKFSSQGNFIAKFGSQGQEDGQFKGPSGIVIDEQGNVYVTDAGNNRVQKFDAQGNFLTTWGSQGTSDGQFQSPNDIALDWQGNMYIADRNRVQKLDNQGNFLAKFRFLSPSGYEVSPSCLAIDGQNNIYVDITDQITHQVQKFDAQGNFLLSFGSRGAGEGQFQYPVGIAVDEQENIYVADYGNNWVQKFSPQGNYLQNIGSSGTDESEFKNPSDVALDVQGNIYVADEFNHRIQKFDSQGNFQAMFGSLGTNDGQFQNPQGIAVDEQGNIYVADYGNNRIQKFDSQGNFITKFGSLASNDGQFQKPVDIALDRQGNVYVASRSNPRVQKFDSQGNFLTMFGSAGTNDGQFQLPGGIAVDGNGNVYVTDYVIFFPDQGNHRVQKFDSQGNFLAKFGSYGGGDGQFFYPNGISIDENGNIYVTDIQQVQKFDSHGNFITKIGSPGTENGQFQQPSDLDVDSQGNLYVADNKNHRVQILAPVNIPNTAPVLSAIGSKSVNELASLLFQASATDDGLPNNTLTYSLVTAATGTYPTGASITAAGAFSWTPTEAQGPATYKVKVVVSDGTLSDEEEIEIQVSEVNTAPILATIGTKTVDELTQLTFTATADDSDLPANSLTYSLVGAPTGATITSAGIFAWVPTEAQGPGSYTFTVKVTDGGTPAMSHEEEITITVNEVNVSPVLSAIGAKSMAVDTNLLITVSASDSDVPVQSLVYSASPLPSGATFDAATRTFSWTPNGNQTGDYFVTFQVSDGELIAQEIVKITVTKPSEQKPAISSFSPTSGPVSTSVTVIGSNFMGVSAVAFNGVNANYNLQSSTSIIATVPAGATTGKISVTNSAGTVTSKQNFTVTSSNPSPTISSFTPSSGPAGTSVSITGTNFIGATAVAFNGTVTSFTVINSTTLQTQVPIGATTGKISVTTPGGTAESKSNFKVTASSTVSGLMVDERPSISVYPNPFKNKALLNFKLNYEGNYVIALYDARGMLVTILKEDRVKPGELHTIEIDGSGLVRGLYVVRLQTDKGNYSAKLVLDK
jgi:tripartite motif-containing protein 71